MQHFGSFGIIGIIIFSLLKENLATIVNDGKDIFCVRAGVQEVKIRGCYREPCSIQKGRRVPIEVKFGFDTPSITDEIHFQAFLPYWNIPGTDSFGSNLASGTDCNQLQLEECPAYAGYLYTLYSTLYVNPNLQSLHGKTYGRVTTNWRIQPTNRTVLGQNGYSVCNFNVELDIVKTN